MQQHGTFDHEKWPALECIAERRTYQAKHRHVCHGWRKHGMQLPKHWLLLQQGLPLPLNLLQLLLQAVIPC